jgi:membrane protease YdiL (CAAX protease family)
MEKLAESPFYSNTKMVYAISGVFVASEIINRLPWEIYRRIGKDRNLHFQLWKFTDKYEYPAKLSFFFLVMVGVILFYRPLRQIFCHPTPSGIKRTILKNLALGLAGGLIAYVMVIPLLLDYSNPEPDQVAYLINGAYSLSHLSLLTLLMLVVLIPISTEIVFRGIFLKVLLEHASGAASILGSSLLFAVFWSGGLEFGVILGFISGILFYRTRHLIASMTAHVMFRCLCLLFLLNHATQ